MQLNHCQALVTGATGGIGQALVDALCQGGARVLAVGRDEIALGALAARHPGQVETVAADLASRDGRARVREAGEAFGANLLLNAAGLNRFGLLETQDEDAIERLIALNVTATLQLTHLLLPLLGRAPEAMIVNVGSTFGALGYPGFAPYCASKFALRGFSEALRRELADTRVKVLYVAPRATRTDMNGRAVNDLNRQLGVAMDAPQAVAAAIVRAIGAGREELHLGWPERLFVRLNGLLPRLVDRALRKQLPVVKRFAMSRTPGGSGS